MSNNTCNQLDGTKKRINDEKFLFPYLYYIQPYLHMNLIRMIILWRCIFLNLDLPKMGFYCKKVKNKIAMFLQPGGMVTSPYYTGFQWDYPNGWAPLQWIVIKGLKKYGFDIEIFEIAKRWMNVCTKMFLKYGKLYENYNVVDFNINIVGRYPLQEGFGWTNAVYERLAVEMLQCKIE